MQLINDLDVLPALYSTSDMPDNERVAPIRFFLPETRWTWWAVEAAIYDADGQQHPLGAIPLEEVRDVLFFGIVEGFETEWGYFALSELEELRSPRFGLPVERDLYRGPVTIANILGGNDE